MKKTNCSYCDIYTNIYENGKIIGINKNTVKNYEYIYSDSRVVKIKRYEYDEGDSSSLEEAYLLQYDSEGKMTGMSIITYGSTIYTNFEEWTFDDKINPFYILWKNIGFILPKDIIL